MKRYKFVNILFLALFLFFSIFSSSFSESDGIDLNLEVGGCNNNGICDVGEEDMFSCPADCTPPPDESSGSVGSLMNNFFIDLTVEVSYDSAIIKWKSNVPTMSNFKWGTSPDYKDGVLRNINFLLNHKVEINNLKDGTLYYFNIQAENYFRVTNSIENQVFRTLSLPDTAPPGNPTKVKASSDPVGITISWENPTDLDFDYIRVMRNTDRYYGSPFVGHLVYEGNGKYFTDINVLEGVKYFYSLFSRDRAGNYSSGSLINIIHNPRGIDNWGQELIDKEKIEPLTFLYNVVQGSSIYDFEIGDMFSLSGDDKIEIKTNYNSKIKNDDMWLEVRDKEMKIISQYFFARERDKDGFISVIIPSFEKGGKYNIAIYKYQNKEIKIMNQGIFQITKIGEKTEINYLWYIFWIIIILLFISLFLWLFVWIKRKRKERNEEYHETIVR